jgi:hypothetical protein
MGKLKALITDDDLEVGADWLKQLGDCDFHRRGDIWVLDYQ